MTEQAYELMHSGEAAPQCCVCNHAAKHRCPACNELICSEHATDCETCLKPHCRQCLAPIEDLLICEKDIPVLIEELERVHLAETAKNSRLMIAELADDLRRCKRTLDGPAHAELKLGFVGSVVDRWTGRLEA